MANPLYDFQVINANGATNMTGTAIVLSNIIDTWQAGHLNFEVQITGTPNGTLTIEGSNQYDAKSNPTAVFVTLAAAFISPALPAVAGAAISYLGSAVINLPRWNRVRYVNTSSTGVLNVWAHGIGS